MVSAIRQNLPAIGLSGAAGYLAAAKAPRLAEALQSRLALLPIVNKALGYVKTTFAGFDFNVLNAMKAYSAVGFAVGISATAHAIDSSLRSRLNNYHVRVVASHAIAGAAVGVVSTVASRLITGAGFGPGAFATLTVAALAAKYAVIGFNAGSAAGSACISQRCASRSNAKVQQTA